MIDEQLNGVPFSENNSNPKELFDIKDIEGKTELTAEQVMIISRLKVMSNQAKKDFNVSFIDDFINNFLKLQLSKDRASRKEFVSAFQSKNDEKAQGLLDRFNLNIGGK